MYQARNGDVLNPLEVESLDFPPPGPPTDSSGNPVVAVGPTLEITRPDGTITLARPGGTVYFGYGQANVGDLDGDGRSDYVVYAYNGASAEAAYLVSGTVAPGTYDPRYVGVRTTAPLGSNTLRNFRAVGDQDGDGADDLALGDDIYSGRAILAGRIGSTVELPRPLLTIEHLVGALQLEADRPPSLVQSYGTIAFTQDGTVDRVELRINGSSTDCLVTTTEPIGNESPQASPIPITVHGWVVDSHRLVEASAATRGIQISYRWNLDS